MFRCRALRAVVFLAITGGCRSDDARVSVSFLPRGPLAVSMLRVRLSDGARTHNLGPADFTTGGASAPHRSRELPTRQRGTLRVAFALVAGAGDTVSRGEVELPLRRDWRYGVDIMPDTADPTRFCFGCQGSRAFGLAAAYAGPAADSVYVVWGGNSIKNPVVY